MGERIVIFIWVVVQRAGSGELLPRGLRMRLQGFDWRLKAGLGVVDADEIFVLLKAGKFLLDLLPLFFELRDLFVVVNQVADICLVVAIQAHEVPDINVADLNNFCLLFPQDMPLLLFDRLSTFDRVPFGSQRFDILL
jgi:hypothetical protein